MNWPPQGGFMPGAWSMVQIAPRRRGEIHISPAATTSYVKCCEIPECVILKQVRATGPQDHIDCRRKLEAGRYSTPSQYPWEPSSFTNRTPIPGRSTTRPERRSTSVST